MRVRAIILVALATLTLACKGDPVDVDAMPDGENPGPTGPIQDRMPTEEDCVADEVFANDAPARLLTRYEFDNTVRDLLGLEGTWARDAFPPENAIDGFENDVYSHTVNALLVRKYMEVAELIAAEAVEQDGYEGAFLEPLLTRAFRRPPIADELAAFKSLLDGAESVWGASKAREMVISAVLQSPQFLYRVEPTNGRVARELVPIDSYEMASRLSYFLWATMPDDQLFEAAAAGELQSKEEVEAQVRRMLRDPKATEMIVEFYRQWLGMSVFDTIIKDQETFPTYAPGMGQDWVASLRAYVEWVHTEGAGDVESLLMSDVVFLTPGMASMYETGVAVDSLDMQRGMEGRVGLLSQPALMALLAYPAQGSPVHRGIFVRERLLCQHLTPPPNANIEPPDPDPTATTRERFRQHTEDGACAGCHRLIDPVGFAFEEFDGIGMYRTEEAGQPVDVSGDLLASGDAAIDGPFVGVGELSARLSTSPTVRSCIADQWLKFAMGRPPTEADLCSVQAVREDFEATEGKFEDLLVAIATSDAMRYRVIQGPDE